MYRRGERVYVDYMKVEVYLYLYVTYTVMSVSIYVSSSIG